MSQKTYGVLRFVAGLTAIIGWIVVIIGALTLVVAFNQGIAFGFMGLLISGGIVLSGLIVVAAGQALDVFIDIARNTEPIEKLTSQMATLVEQNARVLSFFEHMSGKANTNTPLK